MHAARVLSTSFPRVAQPWPTCRIGHAIDAGRCQGRPQSAMRDMPHQNMRHQNIDFAER